MVFIRHKAHFFLFLSHNLIRKFIQCLGRNISQNFSEFFNFLRNSGRFFRFSHKVLDCLRELQNETFNIQRKVEKLQISDKF